MVHYYTTPQFLYVFNRLLNLFLSLVLWFNPYPSQHNIYTVAVFLLFFSPRLQIKLLCFSHVSYSPFHSITRLMSFYPSPLPSSWHFCIAIVTFQSSCLSRTNILINLMAWWRHNNALDNIIDLSVENYKRMEENLDSLTLT